MEKLALVDPAGIVSVVGMWALKLADAMLINAPPLGAGFANVTVPLTEFVPPTTEAGDTAMLTRSAGFTVILPVAVFPATEADIVAVWT
jgi:hypothetical protein